MRIRIELGLKGKTISLGYKSKLQGAIYYMLKKGEKTKDLHDLGFKQENRPFKLFVYSDLIGRFMLNKKTNMMHFETNSYFEISSYMTDHLIEMVRHLQENSSLLIGNQRFDVIDFEVIDDRFPHRTEDIRMISVSPVTVYRTENRKTVYISPTDERYVDMLKDNIIGKYRASGMNEPLVLPEIKVISHKKRSVYFRNTFVEAHNVELVINGLNEACFRLMMTTGLGSKNSMGFGMMRIEDQLLSV